MELLQGVAATLRLPEHDGDPVALKAPPEVTVIRHSDGSVLLEGVASKVGEGEDVHYTVELSGKDLSEVDLLTAVWSDGDSSYTTYTEIVGGFVTSLAAIKEKFGEDVKGGNPDVEAKREAALRAIEGACGVAFRPRYGKEILNGSGTEELLLAQPKLLRVLAASIDGEAVDVDELTLDPVGLLVNPSEWTEGSANVEVAYVHGHESFPPAELPVCDLAAYLLTPAPTDWDQRATSVSNAEGTYSLVTPGVRGASFPLPSVNVFVQEHHYVSVV
jgi:hypothetical protein